MWCGSVVLFFEPITGTSMLLIAFGVDSFETQVCVEAPASIEATIQLYKADVDYSRAAYQDNGYFAILESCFLAWVWLVIDGVVVHHLFNLKGLSWEFTPLCILYAAKTSYIIINLAEKVAQQFPEKYSSHIVGVYILIALAIYGFFLTS
jgi:hypothetical protein